MKKLKLRPWDVNKRDLFLKSRAEREISIALLFASSRLEFSQIIGISRWSSRF